MLSFRVDDTQAAETVLWANKLGIDKSDLLRTALHRHLVCLASEEDSRIWQELPLSDNENALRSIADWGVAEDWSDWSVTASPTT
jgi:antitoxin component of RelBE/YafQ-DinJ toxin-antitoxin module